AGMGTTVVAVHLAGRRLVVAHVGDSRVYLLERSGRLRQVTRDDACADMRHVLTNVVGRSPRTEVHVAELDLQGGERVVLTTDGVHGVLDGRELMRIAGGVEDPGSAAQSLVAAALARGSRDNCTAVVAELS